jgi:hypothetical protein
MGRDRRHRARGHRHGNRHPLGPGSLTGPLHEVQERAVNTVAKTFLAAT